VPDIQSPDPGRKLQDRYNLLGTTPAPFLSPELVPVVLVDDLTQESPGFLWALASDTIVGVGAALSQTRLTNPIGSGVLLENISIVYALETTGDGGIFVSGPALSASAVELWQDRRRSGNPTGRVTLGTDAGALGQELYRFRSLGNVMWVAELPEWKIAPGDLIHFAVTAADQDVAFTWKWTERILPPR